MPHPPFLLAKTAGIAVTDDRRLRPALALALALVSMFTYLLYIGIGALQVAVGTMQLRWLLVGGGAALLANTAFYRLIRRGRTPPPGCDFTDLSPDLRVTFSAGVTTIQAAETDAAAIERADRAMYRAKDDGLNRTVVH